MQIEFRMGRASFLAVTRKSLCSCLCLPTSYAPTFTELKILIVQVSLVAQLVENPPAMQKTWVQSLGWEDSLEEGMAAYSSILAWRIPTDRGAWWAADHGVAKSWMGLSTAEPDVCITSILSLQIPTAITSLISPQVS